MPCRRRERRAEPARRAAGGPPRRTRQDWEGSWRLASSPSRTASGELAYSPYGAAYAGSGPDAFTGQWVDTPDNLNDFPKRFLQPMMARWLSPDPAGLAAVSPADPQSWNAYAYVGDTPLQATDPLGLMTTPDPSALYTESQDYVLEATQGFEGSENEFSLQGIPVRYIGAQPDPIFFFTDVSADFLGQEVSDTVRIWALDPSIIGNGAVLFGGPDPVGLGAGGPSVAFARDNAEAKAAVPLLEDFHAIEAPIDSTVPPIAMLVGAAYHFLAAGTLVVAGCGDPTPAEPVTCGLSVAGAFS